VKIAVTGAAGLIGQNLIARFKRKGGYDIVAFDKHPANTAILRRLHPDIQVIEADLSQPGNWGDALADVDSIVLGHAQIGGLDGDEFTRNNVTATERVLDVLKRGGRPRHIVHISSSVVNSQAVDWYTESKKAQEAVVLKAGFPTVVLRPTLMFGWFDRKHLGWLARFMKKAPIFPIPGNGRYLRQPLYAGDFCDIIITCVERQLAGTAHNISGQEEIDYVDLIRLVREASGGTARIVHIPYRLFQALLATYALVNKDPPFTTKQLAALVIPETFEVIDWPKIFGVPATPLRKAMLETFRDPTYANVTLEF
jgi:nucleoside-diphosphate-sugar epimerase